MANILLADPSLIARTALQGILARGKHRLAAVASGPEVWQFLQHNESVDLLILELKLEGEQDGLALLRALRAHPLLKGLPVLVYTEAATRETAREALHAQVLNFLLKPYGDAAVFAEIAKALAHPWRQPFFAEDKTFCAQQGIDLNELRHRREALHVRLSTAAPALAKVANGGEPATFLSELEDLTSSVGDAGAIMLAGICDRIWEKADRGQWRDLADAASWLDLASRLVRNRLSPSHVSEGFWLDDERRAGEDAAARALWQRAIAEDRLPVVSRARLERAVDDLPNCPIIDSAAAAFQMAATGHPSSLAPLMDLAERDPGLSAQLLIAANRVRSDSTTDPVENARLCVGLLGEERLAKIANELMTVEARRMDNPAFTWAQFWTFQVGVAQIAQHTCRYLELESMEARAYSAGLLHDLGKLLLLRVEPHGLVATVDYAQQCQVPLPVAQRKLLDCTSRELGARFAERQGLPNCFVNVMRWIDAPAESPEDAPLVAVVSLARDLCIHNRVGSSGEIGSGERVPLNETPEWEILRNFVYPSFDLAKFEAQIHNMCRELTREISGRAGAGIA